MTERENLDINASTPDKIPKIGTFKKKLGIGASGVVAFMAIVAVTCGGDDSGDKDRDTATPFRTRVERTVTPTISPTEEATPIVTVLPTPEPTPEPTTVYVPPLVTPRPTLRPTPEPTLEPTPSPIPLEICNTGKFTNLAEEQTIYFYNDVRAQLAHEGNFDQGCDLPGNVGVKVVLVDTYGHEFRWALHCGYTYPISQPDWECFRDGVIISDVNGARWKMELEIDNQIVQTLSVVKG